MPQPSSTSPNARTPRIAVVGAGAWGRNHVRSFHAAGALVAVVDGSEEARNNAAKTYAGIQTFQTLDALMDSGVKPEGVVIATPASTHEALAIQSINNGFDVLVEKPAAQTLAGVERINQAALANHRIFAVGHLMLHHPAVQRAKQLIEAGRIGRVLYLYGQRLNLGKVRTDEDVISSLAPHDLSIASYILGGRPIGAAAWPVTAIAKPQAHCDVAFVRVDYEHGVTAHFHFSWLDPFKRRELVIVGDEGMLLIDDMSVDQKLRVYDKTVVKTPTQDFSEFNRAIEVRDRGVEVVEVSNTEPLSLQSADFLRSIATRTQPMSGYESARAVAEAFELIRKGM